MKIQDLIGDFQLIGSNQSENENTYKGTLSITLDQTNRVIAKWLINESQALEWCATKGAVRPVSLPELIYVKSDILAVNGLQFIGAFHLRPEARSTRLYCKKCYSIIGVDHKSYKNNVFMFFKNHCSTTCDLSLNPDAAIYLKDLEETDEIKKLKSIPLIYTFSEAEFQQFRSIEAVSKSFNDTNRPRFGQNLKSVIEQLNAIEILNNLQK